LVYNIFPEKTHSPQLRTQSLRRCLRADFYAADAQNAFCLRKVSSCNSAMENEEKSHIIYNRLIINRKRKNQQKSTMSFFIGLQKRRGTKIREEYEMRDVYSLIRKLGATSKYKGYYFVAEAIKVSMELEERPIKVTKDVYPVLAKRFKSTPSNIEHNIRTLVNICWMSHRDVMEEIAGYTLEYRPTNSEFLDILVYYLCRMQENTQQYMVH